MITDPVVWFTADGAYDQDRVYQAALAHMLHRRVGYRSRSWSCPLDAAQAQHRSPPPYPEDGVQGRELAGIRGRAASARQPDPVDRGHCTGRSEEHTSEL